MNRISFGKFSLFSLLVFSFVLLASPIALSHNADERSPEIESTINDDATQSQDSKSAKSTPLAAFNAFEGAWVANGTGFSSRLIYEWALTGVLFRSRNELRNAKGELIKQYEGHYAWDAARSKIVFWVVGSDGELHQGEAAWRDGLLWHDATVSGGRITGYRSVLGVAGKELVYRARYEPAATDAAVLSSTPLVYQTEKP
jgi:hypothetical protein